ncbi:MAG: hypothetical protein J6V99_01135 [Neisseriaceae bacterium]|nr:hypothetical protein [Neisseriaceae bacterium]
MMKNNFFIIDSQHLDKVQSQVYGYCVKSNISNENDSAPHLDGAYCLVDVQNGKITVSQDSTGSFGIYLYQKDDYFAISNSLTLLIEYLKDKVSLSLDEDYIKAYFLSGLASLAYSETMVKEIRSLPKDTQLHIDCKTGNLNIKTIDYQPNSVSLNSAEGMQILDAWFYKWTSIIRYLASKTNKLTVDLSGGMDSRMVFLLFVKSGIDMSRLHIRSNTDGLHTHIEDFEIATEIANFYHAHLNNPSYNQDAHPLSTEEFVNLSSYIRLGFCTEIYFRNQSHKTPLFAFTGNGGEALRSHWEVSPKQFIADINRQNKTLGINFESSVNKILNTAFQAACEKYHIDDTTSPEAVNAFYQETRCRNHFGKDMAEKSCLNIFTMAPLLDTALAKLNLNGCKTQKRDLIMSVIFERYCPDLLKFKFDSGRFIDPEILAYARQISKKYPFVATEPSTDNFQSAYSEKTIPDNPSSTRANYQQFVNLWTRAFLSTKLFDDFVQLFPENIYLDALKHRNFIKYHPEKKITPILATYYTNALLKRQNHGDFFAELTDLDSSYKPEDNKGMHAGENEFLNTLLSKIRLDIKNFSESNPDNDLKIVIPDRFKADIQQPKWFQKNGQGYVIHADKNTLNIKVKCVHDGELQIWLRTQDVKDIENKRIHYFVDVTKFDFNGQRIISETTAASHDKPIKHSIPVTAGQILDISLVWEKHYYTLEEYTVLCNRYLGLK